MLAFLPSSIFQRFTILMLLSLCFGVGIGWADEVVFEGEEHSSIEIITEILPVEELPPTILEILPEVDTGETSIIETIPDDVSVSERELAPEETTLTPSESPLSLLENNNPDIPFADTPALESEETSITHATPTESLSIPLFGTDSSGVAVYNMNTGVLLFTTFLEQDTLETSEEFFSENGEYVFFRTNDPNWCSGLSLDQCRMTSIQQATITITNIIEPEEIVNEILSVEEGTPAEEGDIILDIDGEPENILPLIPGEDTPEISESVPADTNTYIPPTEEIIEEVLPPLSESMSETVVNEAIEPIPEISPTIQEGVISAESSETVPSSGE